MNVILRERLPDSQSGGHAGSTVTDEVRREESVRDWYKDAVIYQLHIKAFCDGNGDGIGDFAGLFSHLDYVQQLGVTAIWLLPFYPSPLRDDGYDIAAYDSVHPSYGALDDFKMFVDEAHRRGIRVITELVINHTSDSHPWFQRARTAPAGSPERDFYVWSDTDDRYQETRIIFIDSETSNWTWDPVAKAFFWHRFYSHQPDLNFDNPLVFDEVVKAMRFWLDLGVDGLRLDAVPYLCERDGTNNENLPETHDVLRRIRREIDTSYPDRMLLAEANQWPEDTRPYFGSGDECHMAFHFPLMPRMYMALAQEERHPITDILRQTPEIPDNCQWALFLRNHDELTLEMVTAEERDYLWQTYAVDPRARINLGIRRRLAPLMENDRRKIELMNALLFSMPGTPVIYYGDEIGMGDNYYLGDRDGVRTPMQWSIDRNAGFSRVDPQRLYLPVLMDHVYGYQAVNVEAQQGDASSLLNWTRRMIATRNAHRAFGRGSLTFLYPRNRRILAFIREHEGERILCVANLSRSAQGVELDLAGFADSVPVELLGGAAFPPITDRPYMLTLPAYGHFWFLLAGQSELPRWHVPAPEPLPELVTLVLNSTGTSLIDERERGHLEKIVLPQFLPRQRWFNAKNDGIEKVSVRPLSTLGALQSDFVFTSVHVYFSSGRSQSYSFPVSVIWDEAAVKESSPMRPYALAKVRRGPRVGAVVDAAHCANFCRALADKLRTGGGAGGFLKFESTAAAKDAVLDDTVRLIGGEQSNVSIVVGDAIAIKLYRRIEPGIQPEIEIARHLSDVAFRNSPQFLGCVTHNDESGNGTPLAVAFAYVPNQGDAWSVVTNGLEHIIEQQLLSGDAVGLPDLAFPVDIGSKLGQRTAELHRALAVSNDDAAFTAEPVVPDDISLWIADTHAEASAAVRALRQSKADIDERAALATELEHRVAGAIDKLSTLTPSGFRTRYHGDYHLGQILVVESDLMIIDFEGEPRRTLDERRRKNSPLIDVSGMIRSFDYAAWAVIDRLSVQGTADIDKVRRLAFQWRDHTTQNFLNAYNDDFTAADAGLIDLFLLRKALYELQYELESRPAWLPTPVRGIIAMLDRMDDQP